MGRYLPPDIDPSKTNTNTLHRRRAPGTLTSHRQRVKNADGTTSETTVSSQTVRFEMPFPIWCATCPKPTIIGQGVRFNARKSAAGKYHSTTIWRFDMRHAECGGEISMQTDPKNTAYIVLSGATKRSAKDGDEGDLVSTAQGPIVTDAERENQRQSAFSNLEKTIADRERLIQANERISSLMTASSRHWDDPYTQNQKLRKLFRVGRKEREKDAAATEDLQDRMSLGVDLLPESEDDRARAALVDFGPVVDSYEDEDGGAASGAGGSKALSKPLFKTAASSKASSRKASPAKGVLKAERVAAKRKDDFVTELMDNTRAVQDPFLNAKDAKGPSRLPGVKRKRDTADIERDSRPSLEAANSRARAEELPPTTTTTVSASSALVDYDSDD